MQVRQRGALRRLHVAPALDRAAAAAGHHDRELQRIVGVAVPHAGAVEDHHLVEERGVAVLGRAELLEEAREDPHVQGVDPGQLLDLLGTVAVVRHGVVRLRNPHLRVGAHALLAAVEERGDAREVGLERHQHQVEHQAGVLLEAGRDAGRLRHLGQSAVALRLGDLDAPLDVAHRVEIAGQLGAVAAAELAHQVGELLVHRVEDAAVHPQRAQPRLAAGAAHGAEQVLEHRARVGLHRHRRVGVAPGERGAVGAAVAVLALAHQLVGFQRQLERGELRVLAQGVGSELVHRHADLEGRVRAGGLHGVRAGQVRRLAARVVAVALVQPLLGFLVGGAADDQHPVLHGRQRRQDRRELQAAHGGRRPVRHAHAVGDVDGAEPLDGTRRAVAHRGEGRHHAVEQRQRDGRAETPERRAARQVLLRNHHLEPLFRNADRDDSPAAATAARRSRPRAPSASETVDSRRCPG